MENKHISICPICGSRNINQAYDGLGGTDGFVCLECSMTNEKLTWVIPLVTPKEEK